MSTYRVAVLLSGTGRSLANLVARRDSGELPIELAGVVSSRRGVRGLEIAEGAGLDVRVVPRRDHADTEAFGIALTDVIEDLDPDLVVMAGFLSYYPIPERFLGKVINIHPSLLPLFGGEGFYGDRVHRAVLASGMRVSGCTVHFVDDRYDHGPVIAQRACEVAPHDTVDDLAARVFAQECEALPAAIRDLAEGRVRLEDGKAVWA